MQRKILCMLLVIFLNLFLNADYKVDIQPSKYIDTSMYMNGYDVSQKSLLNFVKTGVNEFRVCFQNKSGKSLRIKDHVRVDLKSTLKATTDIVVDGALIEVKSSPILSFYSLKTNSNKDWLCETKQFTHNGDNYLYFYLAQQEVQKRLKPSMSKKAVKKTKKVQFNAINAHQSSILKVYKKFKNYRIKKDKQVRRNLKALIGEEIKVEILGRWKDKKTGVVYNIKPNAIEVSNMPKGFYMDYKKVSPSKLRVKVLNNSFDLLYKLKSKNEMIQKNTQSGVVRELIRL